MMVWRSQSVHTRARRVPQDGENSDAQVKGRPGRDMEPTRGGPAGELRGLVPSEAQADKVLLQGEVPRVIPDDPCEVNRSCPQQQGQKHQQAVPTLHGIARGHAQSSIKEARDRNTSRSRGRGRASSPEAPAQKVRDDRGVHRDVEEAERRQEVTPGRFSSRSGTTGLAQRESKLRDQLRGKGNGTTPGIAEGSGEAHEGAKRTCPGIVSGRTAGHAQGGVRHADTR